MKRWAILAAVLVASVPAGARASHPTSEECTPITCVTAHTQLDVGCGADGRDGSACLGTARYEIAFDSPLPIESMDYSIDVACSVPCVGSGTTSGRCGWAPPEIRPVGETGCSISGVRSVTFAAQIDPGSCATYLVTAKVDVAAVLDPLASVHHEAADTVEVCGA